MASNNSLLDTNLNIDPYFDDFDPSKQYYKILFKPDTAVQVRELNQLQTILQNQVASFGQNIFKEGSVIKGCSFTFDSKYAYVKLGDTYANGSALTVEDLNGLNVLNSNGLKAVVVNTVTGLISTAPNLNTVYVKYLNSGVYANGSAQNMFDPSETLQFLSSANVAQGNVFVSNTAEPVGYGYAFNTTEGIIFKKGYFIEVTPQTVIVDKYDNVPDAVSVGFDAVESIITSNSDESLLDNSSGSPNFSAPGADRLKLEPRLLVKNTATANVTSFFSLVDFKQGQPVTIRQDTQFASVAKEVARRTFETNGNFVVKPFVVTTAPIANSSDADFATHFNAIISKGLGYVEGYRVEFLNNNTVKVRRGTDVANIAQQSVSLNFGYYVRVNEISGTFGDPNFISQVELHSVAKTSITSKTFLASSFSPTTKIGTAYVRGFAYDSGSQGAKDCQYRLYLYEIVMNPGMNFKDVRSFAYIDSSVLEGCADVVTTYSISSNANVALLSNPNLSGMIYPFGQSALKPDGFNHVQFTYRRLANTQILTDGSGTVNIPAPVGSGTESFPFSGVLSASQMNDLQIVPTANGFSSNKTGTVQIFSDATSVVGSGTTFISDYAVGDVIHINSTNRVVGSVTNNNFLSVDTNFNANSSGLTHQKAFLAGNPIPMATRPGRSVTVSSNTLTISLNENVSSAFNIQVAHSVNRAGTAAIKKQIKRQIFVKIDCSNNAGGYQGPWTLGVPDVFTLEGVYIDTSGNRTYVNTGINQIGGFVLDNGQHSAFYGLAQLSPTTDIVNKMNANTTVLVQLSCFTYDTSQGVGFFTANSYPIDDVHLANTNAITTSQIPSFTSDTGQFYDLRDCVDFRAYATATANTTNAISSATINPSATMTFNYAAYLPVPDSTFEADLSYYLPRVDRMSLDIGGNIVVTEGLPSATNPAAPLEKSGTMTLALLKIPPYPSLTTGEAKQFGRYDLAIEAQASQNRRYTMKDIAGFDKRITNLEYYTSLSLLESTASTLQVRSTATGQTRFQNGIFVDPFNGFDLSNTKHPKFYIAIDPDRTELRPAFVQYRSDFTFDPAMSSGVTQHGELVLLNHTSNNVYISQQYASKFRNAIDGNIYTWRGTITLDPPGSTAPDTTTAPDVVNNIDLAQNWVNLQNAWGTQWGNWQTVSTTYANTLIKASTSTSQRVGDVSVAVDSPTVQSIEVDRGLPTEE